MVAPKKNNNRKHKKIVKHLKDDMKGFREEISGDEALIQKLLKKKASRAMIIDHLKEDIGYYGREAKQDKKIIKHLKSAPKKPRHK